MKNGAAEEEIRHRAWRAGNQYNTIARDAHMEANLEMEIVPQDYAC